MTQFKSFLVLLLTSVLVVSCSPADYSVDPATVDFTKNFGNAATRDFLGQVVDINNLPVQDATIAIGTFTAQTDGNGVFMIKGASVYEKFGYITATKAGYMNSSRTVVPANGVTNVKITMYSATATASVSSGVSSEVSLANGAKITFGGGFKTEAGTAYSGSVSVVLHYLDAGDAKVANKMQGMLYGANSDVQARVLRTFGMIGIELRGGSGEKLQISNSATINIPINATQLASAPSSIQLWYFDETVGYWKQEGSANKQGDKYVGNVSRISWWNCANQYSGITLRLKIANSDGNYLAGTNVGIMRTGDIFPIMRATNADGQMNGIVPSNEVLTMNVYDNCGNIIRTSSIGPFAIPTALPNTIITNDIAPSNLVKGRLFKCDNTSVVNGYVLMNNNTESSILPTTSTGTYSFYNLVCSTGTIFSLKGGDYDDHQTTDYVNYQYTSPITYTGNLKTCNTITEFISYKIDNGAVKYISDNFNVNVSGASITISGNNVGSPSGMDVYGQASTTGVYTTTQFTIDSSADIGTIDSSTTNTISFDVNNIGPVDGYIDMTFNGTYTVGSTVHNITGTVHVKRDH